MLTLFGAAIAAVIALAYMFVGAVIAGTVGVIGLIGAVSGGFLSVISRCLAPAIFLSRTGLRQGGSIIALLTLIFGGALAWGYFQRDNRAAAFVATDRRAVAPILWDGVNHFIGILSPGTDPTRISEAGFADYASVWGPRPAEPLWECLQYLEDRRLKSWVLALGFDPIAVGRTLLGFVTGQGGGGSTLLNQVARSMRGRTPSRREALFEKFRRKLAEWSDSPALMLVLQSGEVDPGRFVTANLPLLAGAPQSRVGALPYGADAAALLLWNRFAADLDPTTQYILAAADWAPILLAAGQDPAQLKAVDRRWAALQHRALRCLTLLAQPNTPDYESAKQQLLAVRPPRFAIGEPGNVDQKSSPRDLANPGYSARWYLGASGLGLISRELSNNNATPPLRDRVVAAHLRLDADQNRIFVQRIQSALEALEYRLGAQLRLHLTGPDDAPDRAQVLVAVTDFEGNIVRFYQTGPSFALDDKRPAGSLGKALIAAPVLGSLGDQLGSLYCNRQIKGIHNPGHLNGDTGCGTAKAWVRADEAYAKSLTLALINRLGAVPGDKLRKAADALGFQLPADIPAQTAVPLGLFEATPREFLRAMIAIGRITAGLEGDVSMPRMVSSIDTFSDDGAVSEQAPPLASSLYWAELRPWLQPSASYLRNVLAAPLAPGGTLAGLGSHARGIGKTGTSSTPDRATRDAMIVGAIQTSEAGGFAYFVLVGTPNPSHPLGSIVGGNLTALAQIVLDQVVTGELK